MDKLVLITGISGSGKTTLQQSLMSELGFVRPINFTTREPRNDNELDEYIFITKEQYFFKMGKGDFLESTNYNGNWYGVSSHLQEGDVCIVLDPIGREQVKEKMARLHPEVKVLSIYLELPKDVQSNRLIRRGDDEEKIKERLIDSEWFSPSQNDIIIDGTKSEKGLFDEVCEILKRT